VSAGFVATALTGGALIVALVNVPLFTNVVLAGSALEGGLNLMRLTAALAIGALAGGWLASRWGLRAGAATGLLLAAAGFVAMSRWDETPGEVAFSLPLIVAGFGFGLIIAPLNTAVLSEAADTDRATTASLLTVARLLGALVGVALLTTRGLSGFYAEAGLIPLDDPAYGERLRGLQLDAFSDTFLAAAGVCLLALLAVLWLEGRPLFRRERQISGRDSAIR
jgi:MFS family permease